VGIIVILLLTGILGYGYYDTQIKPWSQVVVEVNDAQFDLDYYVKMLLFASGGSELDPSLLPPPDSVLHYIADGELIREGAKRYGLAVTSEEIVEKCRKDILGTSPGDEGSTSDATFKELYQQRLKKCRLSDEEYHQFVRFDLLRERMGEYLAEQVLSLPTIPQVYLHTMMFESEEKAAEIINRLNEGEDFAELARENSLNKTSGGKEGDLGWIPRGLLSPELEEVAFSLDLNVVSQQPILAEGIYYVLMVSEKKDAELEDLQREALKSKALSDWLSTERESSTVKYHFGPEQHSWVMDHL
jgi:foldase protein PrsA